MHFSCGQLRYRRFFDRQAIGLSSIDHQYRLSKTSIFKENLNVYELSPDSDSNFDLAFPQESPFSPRPYFGILLERLFLHHIYLNLSHQSLNLTALEVVKPNLAALEGSLAEKNLQPFT